MPCGKPSYIGWKTTNEIRCKPVRGKYVNKVLWFYRSLSSFDITGDDSPFTCLSLSTMPPAQITASCYLTKTLAFNWSPKHPTAQTSASLSINGFIGAQLVIGNNQKDTQKYEEYICRKTNEMRTETLYKLSCSVIICIKTDWDARLPGGSLHIVKIVDSYIWKACVSRRRLPGACASFS